MEFVFVIFGCSGCKFTTEEERVVIELQSQLGNKWAKIATYLPGRTDNDVKNFWSSRQKRLARILQASDPNPRPRKAKNKVSVHDFSCLKTAPIPNYSMVEQSAARAHLCSSSSYVTAAQPLSTVQLPLTTMKPALDTNLVQIEPLQQLPFHQIPQPHLELGFSPESQQVLVRLEDPYPFNVIEPPETEQLHLGLPFFDPTSAGFQNPEPPDIFFDGFPTDMFNSFEQLPSP